MKSNAQRLETVPSADSKCSPTGTGVLASVHCTGRLREHEGAALGAAERKFAGPRVLAHPHAYAIRCPKYSRAHLTPPQPSRKPVTDRRPANLDAVNASPPPPRHGSEIRLRITREHVRSPRGPTMPYTRSAAGPTPVSVHSLDLRDNPTKHRQAVRGSSTPGRRRQREICDPESCQSPRTGSTA